MICFQSCISMQVCSNYNQTWGSDCEIHRMRCNCEEKSEKCSNPEFSHLHVEYYGACKQLSVSCSNVVKTGIVVASRTILTIHDIFVMDF